MGLGDISKKLYQKKDKLKDRKPPEDTYDSTEIDQPHDNFQKREDEILERQGTTEPTEKEVKSTNRKFFALGGAVLAVLVGIVLLVFIYYKFIGGAFLEEKVLVEIDGPDEVRSAEQVYYKVLVKNNNRVSLENTSVVLSYPDEMVLQKEEHILQQGFNRGKIEVGEIKAKGEKEIQVGFRPFGPRDRQAYLNATLTYRPSNFSSNFEKSKQKSVMIKSSPISIAIVPTKEAASGDSVEVDVIIKNNSSNEFNNLELRMDYPEGFSYSDSSAIPLRDNRVWKIENIGSNEQKKIKISGMIQGQANSLKNFKAVVGQTRDDDKFLAYTELEGAIKIIASRVEIIQEIKNTKHIYAGDEIEYRIKFRNTSDVALRDLILTENVSSRVINLKKIRADDGYYDSRKKTITWKAAQVPELKLLKPGQGGEVIFKVEVLDQFPMKNENDKNFTIESFAELESLDVDSPIWRNKKIKSPTKIVKVNSKVVLNLNFAYNDGEIPNSGPVPLKVLKETTFTGRMNVMNTSNDLKNVIVYASLPPGINWKDKHIPDDPNVEFNDRTNEFKWVIGSLDAGVGFISPLKSLAFQIGVKPSENQRDYNMSIFGKLRVEGLDTFTGNDVLYEFRETRLAEVSDIEARIELE